MKTQSQSVRLELGSYFADIITNRDDPNHFVYFWIIQKTGSTNVDAFGQCETFAEAKAASQRNLKILAEAGSAEREG